jgi:coenzyme F420-dependent glucose-6-phosphate dehydrogenase
MGTSVLTPTLRYRPAVIAQAFATLACLSPGRVFLGAGTGEAMNETPTTGREWPSAKERRLRLAEAINLMRALWSDDRVTFEGNYYRTELATVYDRPEIPIPVYVAASGPLAAKLAGRVGDGFICTSGKRPELYEELLAAVEEGARGAGRDPSSIARMIEVKVSYDHDAGYAHDACHWWATLALTADRESDVHGRSSWAARRRPADRAHTASSSRATGGDGRAHRRGVSRFTLVFLLPAAISGAPSTVLTSCQAPARPGQRNPAAKRHSGRPTPRLATRAMVAWP